MDFSNIVTNAAASVTGNVQKAVIKLKDERPVDAEKLNRLEAVMAGGGSGMSGTGGAMGITSDMSKLKDGTGGVADKLGGDKINRLKEDPTYNKMFEVQFNPSSMSISGYGGAEVAQKNFSSTSGSGASNNMTEMSPNLQFSVKLIFDQMDLGKTFPGDNFNLNASAALNTAKKAVTDKVMNKGTVNSVQTVVEGFIAACRNPKTSTIAFCWGDVRYSGKLIQVGANYTLFDATGKPVRAVVDLTIYLRDPDVKVDKDVFDLGYWMAAYQTAFKDSNSYVSVGQQLARSIPGINKLIN